MGTLLAGLKPVKSVNLQANEVITFGHSELKFNLKKKNPSVSMNTRAKKAFINHVSRLPKFLRDL